MNRCPSEQTLRRYLDEQPRDGEPNEIDQHIEGCPDCEAVLDRLLDDEAVAIPSWVKVQIQTRPDSPVVAPLPIRQEGGDASENGSTPPQPPPSDATPPGAGTSRYEPLKDKEVGKGGIGVVYRAHDVTLNRVVAVKVLLEKHCGDEAERRRFLAEAELTGQLRHPGIVEVYDVGIFPDGRPYFAMKLISGQTLRELLTERPDPAQELPRFLNIFEGVCQAVAHAHAERVIHRDLKPANVIVGEFGEVQVMDWGMAKKLAPEGPAESESPERGETVRSVSPGGETDPNTVKGTPAYMAPEQARGGMRELNERCDVFGLGAILCEILTGKPPYDGESAGELCLQAARANLAGAFARLDGCGAGAALVGLAKRCLAAEKESRPRDAGALARELRAYRVRVAQRSRRRIQLALAATVLLLFAVGSAAAWQYQKARTEEEAQQQRERDRPVRQLAAEAKRWRLDHGPPSVLDQKALNLAKKAVELAQTSGASAAVTQEAKQLRDELQRELDEREDSWMLVALLRVHGPDYDLVYKGILSRRGLDVDNTTSEKAAEWRKARPPAVVTEVAAALDRWASERRRRGKPWQHLAELARALDKDPDPRRSEMRDILARDCLRAGPSADRDRLLELARQTNPAPEPVLTLLVLTLALREARDDAEAVRLLRAALNEQKGEVLLHVALGHLLESKRPPELGEAMKCYDAARALRPALRGLQPKAWQERGPFPPVSGRLAYECLRNPSAVSVRQRERLDARERKLPYVLSGDAQLDNALDQLDYAVLCGHYKRYHAISVHFYLDAFADPKLEWYKTYQHRYGAARAAVLAASGQGEDARNLPDKVAVMFRRHALNWLRADLKYYSEMVKQRSDVRDEQTARQFVWNELERWHKDPDLASVRDEQALGLLPEADRAAWREFWADVKDLREKTKDQPTGREGRESAHRRNWPRSRPRNGLGDR